MRKLRPSKATPATPNHCRYHAGERSDRGVHAIPNSAHARDPARQPKITARQLKIDFRHERMARFAPFIRLDTGSNLRVPEPVFRARGVSGVAAPGLDG